MIVDPSASGQTRPSLAASAVRETATGDLIVKIVNGANSPRPLRLKLAGFDDTASGRPADRIVLAGPDPETATRTTAPPIALPQTDTLRLTAISDFVVPANSLTVLRIPA